MCVRVKDAERRNVPAVHALLVTEPVRTACAVRVAIYVCSN